MITLEEIAKKYAKEPPIEVNISELLENIKSCLYDIDSIKETYKETRKIEENSTDSFFDTICENKEEKLKAFDTIYNEILESLKYVNKVGDINALDIESLEEERVNQLAIYIAYTDLIELFIGKTSLEEEEEILKITTKSNIPTMYIVYNFLIDNIFKNVNKFIGEERASFVVGVATYQEEINKRKLPKWVFRDYGYLIDEIIRLKERPPKIIDITIDAIRNGEVIEEDENGVVIKVKPKEKPIKYKRIELPLFRFKHSDVMTIADTELLEILTDKSLKINFETIKKTEKTIENLEQIDRDILDYIVLDLYAIQNQETFTNRDIAIHFEKPTSSCTITTYTLKEINKSLDRLQQVRISEGMFREDLTKETKDFIERRSPFIWLDTLDVEKIKGDKEENITHYRIIDEPPYYRYAVDTKKISQYPRELLIKDIEHLSHTLNTTALKTLLIRQILKLEYFNEISMDVSKIYDALKVTDSRKHSECIKKARKILNTYKAEDYNFLFDIKGEKNRKAKKTLVLTKVKGKPLKKEEIF